MSYELDGIDTAMEAIVLPTLTSVKCPCGYNIGWRHGASRSSGVFIAEEDAANALRFHYTQCPAAKVRVGDYIEGYGTVVGASGHTGEPAE